MTPTLIDGLILAGIVGGVQGIFKTIDWFGKRYFEKNEKKFVDGETAISTLQKSMEAQFIATGNSLLQLRNDFQSVNSKITSIDSKTRTMETDIDELFKKNRNVEEALRTIDRDHCDMHQRDLKISEILKQP